MEIIQSFTTESSEQLRSFIERLEELEKDKIEISRNIQNIYNQAKYNGFNPKIIRKVLKLKKMRKEELIELDILTDLYKKALGID